MSSTATSQDLTLPALFSRALKSASKASTLASADDETQALIQSAIADIRTLSRRLDSLSLFSPNETLEDISTRDLVYIFVPFVLGEVVGRATTSDIDERQAVVTDSQSQFRRFLTLLNDYEIIPADEKSLFGEKGATSDPSKRRETKIKQFQKEKEIRKKIEVVRARKHAPPASESSLTDFDLIASLLDTAGIKDDDDEDEDDLREVTLLLLRLTYTQANTQLASISQELELLRGAPREDKRGDQKPPEKEEDNMWRLDNVARGGPDGKGLLLDSKGKPLRPFTIVSSSSTPADRARLQAEVFRPDHRLPTMTVEEYLEEENRRGNIISGGGAKSGEGPTTSEQLAIDSEQDGTWTGEEKSEEKRLKDEEWAQFKEKNPKGSGNTMNRG